MNKIAFRIYIVLDYDVKLFQVLEKLREDYEVVEGLTFEWFVERRDLSKVPWEHYSRDARGLKKEYIAKTVKDLVTLYGEKYHSVCFIVNSKNWQNGELKIGGWNVHISSKLGTQICKGYTREEWLLKVMQMEIAHYLDETIFRETGVKLEKYLNLPGDVDEIIIHGTGERYEMYKYRPFFRQIAPLLLQTFKRRNERYKKVLRLEKKRSLLEQIVDIYRQLILLIRKKKTLVLEAEITEGKVVL